MENLLLEMRSELKKNSKTLEELKQISKTLEELKAENSLLRKEIFGIGNSSNSGSENCVGLMKNETLLEIVEKIQFDVGKIKEAVYIERMDTNDKLPKEIGRDGVSPVKKRRFQSSEQSVEEYKPVRIRSEEEEDERLTARWNEFKQRRRIPLDGSTLSGTNLGSIQGSIKLSENVKTSIVLIVSNHLPWVIESITEFCIRGRRIRGPSEIKSQTREVFSFEGDSKWCSFLISFKISPTLSLAVGCGTRHDDAYLGAGFTPPDIPVDSSLQRALEENLEFTTNVFSTGEECLEDILTDCVITKGDYLAHTEMTPGPQADVQVDIWKERIHLKPMFDRMEGIGDGESVRDITVVDYLSGTSKSITNVTLLPVACVVEIVNGLGVSLKNSQIFMRKPVDDNKPPPSQILSFTREMFCVADESVVNGIFSYEMEETDLKLVVAFKCGDGEHSCFCATIGPLETELNEQELEKLLDPTETWKTLESRKFAQAKDGEQLIVARNVHVTVSMTNGKISTLKIALFSV